MEMKILNQITDLNRYKIQVFATPVNTRTKQRVLLHWAVITIIIIIQRSCEKHWNCASFESVNRFVQHELWQ